MNTTVAVCSSDDDRLLGLVDRLLGAGVRVVVGTTADERVQSALEARGVPYAVALRGSHGATANAAVAEVPAGHGVLLIDSDCTIEPSVVGAVDEALRDHHVVRVAIDFADDGTTVSRHVARFRRFEDRFDNPAFKPGLGLDAATLRQFQPLFDETLLRGCDAELSTRLRRHGIRPHRIDAAVGHPPTPLRHLLASNVLFGADDAARCICLGDRDARLSIRAEIRRYRALRSEVPRPALPVALAADAAYLTGWLKQAARLATKGRP